MSSSAPPSANVFSSFLQGLSNTSPDATPRQASEFPDSGLELLGGLRKLAMEPSGRLPFQVFAQALPGDSVATLSSVVQMMSKGWVEFVGQISEESDVRITDAGRKLLSTLDNNIASA